MNAAPSRTRSRWSCTRRGSPATRPRSQPGRSPRRRSHRPRPRPRYRRRRRPWLRPTADERTGGHPGPAHRQRRDLQCGADRRVANGFRGAVRRRFLQSITGSAGPGFSRRPMWVKHSSSEPNNVGGTSMSVDAMTPTGTGRPGRSRGPARGARAPPSGHGRDDPGRCRDRHGHGQRDHARPCARIARAGRQLRGLDQHDQRRDGLRPRVQPQHRRERCGSHQYQRGLRLLQLRELLDPGGGIPDRPHLLQPTDDHSPEHFPGLQRRLHILRHRSARPAIGSERLRDTPRSRRSTMSSRCGSRSPSTANTSTAKPSPRSRRSCATTKSR